MKFLINILLLSVFGSIISCASTNKLPAIPNYNTRDHYQNLVKGESGVDGDLQQMQFNRKSFEKMHHKFKEYANSLNCTAKGIVNVSVVVNKESMVDAPVLKKSLTEKCDKAALLALTHLRFEEPSRVDGKPVDAVIAVPFKL